MPLLETALMLLAGMLLFAGLFHAMSALFGRLQTRHFLLSATTTLCAGIAVTGALGFSESSVTTAATLNRWNVFFVLAALTCLLAFYVSHQPRWRKRLVVINLGIGLVFVAINAFEPTSLQLLDARGVTEITLPWGENLFALVGTPNPLLKVAGLWALAVMAYGVAVFWTHWRRDRRSASLVLLLASSILLLSSLQAVASRLGWLDFPPLGIFGFLVVSVAMSLTFLSDDQIRRRDAEEQQRRLSDTLASLAAASSGPKGQTFFGDMLTDVSRLLGNTRLVMAFRNSTADTRFDVGTATADGPTRLDVDDRIDASDRGAGALNLQTDEKEHDRYIGRAFFGAPDELLGVVAAQEQAGKHLPPSTNEVLAIVASRVGAELARDRSEQHIRRLAYVDTLTGLASRAALVEAMEGCIAAPMKSADASFALVHLDIDRFRTINDALSPGVGDAVLQAFSRSLSDAARRSLCIARLGGDDFAVLLGAEAIETGNDPETFTAELLTALAAPCQIGERTIDLSVSAGIATFPLGHDTADRVLGRAEMALRVAKHRGAGRHAHFSSDLQSAAERRLRVEEGLRHALSDGGLHLHFQPKVNFDGRTYGVETLTRWNDPELGIVNPAEFIAVAEESGLILALGRWVVGAACQQLAKWDEDHPGLIEDIAINVSPWQLGEPDVVEQLTQAARDAGIVPKRIILELTESTALADLADSLKKLRQLREVGFRIALDDFGTGYSSLAQLRHLPLDELKIDRAFVEELDGRVQYPLASPILSIGRHLELKVVAEGVETEQQHEVLRALGCRNFQGFLFGRPMDAAALIARILEQRA